MAIGILVLASAPAASAQTWSVRASAATYILPDEDNCVQPTVAVDRKAAKRPAEAGRYA